MRCTWFEAGRGRCYLEAGHPLPHEVHTPVAEVPDFSGALEGVPGTWPTSNERVLYGLTSAELDRLRATAVDEACADGPFDPTYVGPPVDLVERPGQTKIPVWVTPLQACGLAAGPDREVAREALAALTQWLEEPA